MSNVGWCAASCVLTRCFQDPASCCASASPKHETNSRLSEEPNFYSRGLPLWNERSEVQRDRNIHLDLALTSESEALTTQRTELSVFPANNITCIYACSVHPHPSLWVFWLVRIPGWDDTDALPLLKVNNREDARFIIWWVCRAQRHTHVSF